MNGDEAARSQLQELILDGVAPLSAAERETMFERTFAAEPGAGAELLPPDGLFDPTPDDVLDTGPDGTGPDGTGPDVTDPAFWDGPADVGTDAGDAGFGDDHGSDVLPGPDPVEHTPTDHDAQVEDPARDIPDPGDQSW